jgi:aromatic ring-opening dioxygenase catalytic subunit (LigB family)
MGELVGVFAASHAPGLTGWSDDAEPAQRERVLAGYRALRARLEAARPTALVMIANDHLLNFPVDAAPDFAVALAAEHTGPEPWFEAWLQLAPYRVPGHPELARTIVREATRAGVQIRPVERLRFDDNFSVPLHLLTPAMQVPLVPITMNCIVPPRPSPELCYEVGGVLRRIIEERRPADERVAIVATGGLSHEPGGPRYFQVDEQWDRWFLDLLAEGSPERVLREVTLEKLEEGGAGGTSELLAWIVALGAVGRRPATVLAYEPVVQWRCGMGVVAWE